MATSRDYPDRSGINRFGEEKIRPDIYEDEYGMRHPYAYPLEHLSHGHRIPARKPPARNTIAGKVQEISPRNDEYLKEEVCEALYMDPELDAGEIEVSVTDSVVRLTGQVRIWDDKFLAEDLSRVVSGVKDVKNEIRIFKEEVNEADQQRFENDDFSPYAGPEYREKEHPGVSGKNRDGETWINNDEYDAQRNFMGKGPKGYRRSDDRIYEEVCEALQNDPTVDASDIGVKVQDGIVTLEGHARDRMEKRVAEMVTVEVPGVLDVRNDISIV